jgi:predicted GNAT family acetyltransferase
MTVPPVRTYDAERSRVEVRVDDELVAWVDLRPGGRARSSPTPRSSRAMSGRAWGQVAVRAAVEHIAGEGESVIAVCPFARAVIGSDPELARA